MSALVSSVSLGEDFDFRDGLDVDGGEDDYDDYLRDILAALHSEEPPRKCRHNEFCFQHCPEEVVMVIQTMISLTGVETRGDGYYNIFFLWEAGCKKFALF